MDDLPTLEYQPTGGMTISIRSAGAVTVFVLKGRMQDGDAARFAESFRRRWDSGARCFIFDLGALTYIDSTLIAEVIASRKRATKGSGTVELIAPPGSKVRQILQITALDRVFEVFDALAQAHPNEAGSRPRAPRHGRASGAART